MGLPKNNNYNSKLLQEQKVYGDLLQFNVQENWNRLVLKSLGFLDWAASHVNSLFIAKADVDSFLNISSILTGLESIGNPNKLSNIPTIYGSLVKEVVSLGWGHWRIPATFCCKKHIFPDYHSGGAMIYENKEYYTLVKLYRNYISVAIASAMARMGIEFKVLIIHSVAFENPARSIN